MEKEIEMESILTDKDRAMIRADLIDDDVGHVTVEVETFARVLVVAGCPLANQIVAAYQAKGIPAEIVR